MTNVDDMAEVLVLAESICGNAEDALRWYRQEPLPGFGGATADNLVRHGKTDMVKAHLRRIRVGGYA